MKKFLTDILKFLLLASIIYLCGIFVWGKIIPQKLRPNLQYIQGAYGFMYTRAQEVRQVEGLDILILGSSHAYRGFDVRIFNESGYKTFNLGSSAQSPIQTYLLLTRYLDLIKPKLVIYEVYPATFCTDGVESAIDIISNDDNDFYSLIMTMRTKNIKVFNTLIYAYLNEAIGGHEGFIENQMTEEDKYVSGGYVEKDLRTNSPREQQPKKWEIRNNQLDAFYDIIDLLKSQNIPTVLMMAPITNNLYESYENTGEFENLVKRTGLDYINFNGAVALDDSLHFYDAHHLNQNGVEIFNSICIDSLRNLKILK